jgi:hypothetical protein
MHTIFQKPNSIEEKTFVQNKRHNDLIVSLTIYHNKTKYHGNHGVLRNIRIRVAKKPWLKILLADLL